MKLSNKNTILIICALIAVTCAVLATHFPSGGTLFIIIATIAALISIVTIFNKDENINK